MFEQKSTTEVTRRYIYRHSTRPEFYPISRMLPLYATISNVNQKGLWQIPTNDLTLISLFLPTMHERLHKRLGLSLENSQMHSNQHIKSFFSSPFSSLVVLLKLNEVRYIVHLASLDSINNRNALEFINSERATTF